MTNTRQTQMKWLLGLTALSLVPVYVLLGWQSGGHSPDEITTWLVWFWRIEAIAWGIRALVEAWTLVYLFQTVTSDRVSSRVLMGFEVALITLIALTVGMVVLTNGDKVAIAKGLPYWLYIVWSFSVATFAPLMMGSIGFAYKVHQIAPIKVSIPKVKEVIHKFEPIPDNEIRYNPQTDEKRNGIKSIIDRRSKLSSITTNYQSEFGKLPTQQYLSNELGVSIQTVRSDIKALNGVLK